MTPADTQANALIEEHVRRLLTKMGFDECEVSCRTEEDAEKYRLIITIEAGDDGKLLIGTQGATLASFQHILRSVLRRQITQQLYISLDINGYRAQRERSIQVQAVEAAKKAASEGRVIALKPMSSYDRRAVHTALADMANVQTESSGDGEDRRVLVKPTSL